MMRRPVAVEPVKLTMSTRGSVESISPIVLSDDVITLSTPGGMSGQRAASSPSSAADHGVSGAPLSTTVQPAASAGAVFARLICVGKFHGVIAPTTPTGSRSIQRCDLMPNTSPTPRSVVHE